MVFNKLPPEVKRPLGYLSVILLVAWIVAFFVAIRAASVGDCVEKTGQMGDTFGILTSFVTCIALVGAVASSMLQIHQLENERAKNHLEHQLPNLERIVFAFRTISISVGELLLGKASLITNMTPAQQELKMDLSKEEIQNLRQSLLNSQSEAEILVWAYCPQLEPIMDELQNRIGKFCNGLPSMKREDFRVSLLRVTDAAESGRKEAVNLLRELSRANRP